MEDVVKKPLVSPSQRFAGELIFLAAIVVYGVSFYRSMDGLREIARAFPLFALALLALLVLINLVGATRRYVASRDDGGRVAAGLLGGLGANLSRGRSSIVVFVSLVGFTWLIPRLGFFTAQAAFLTVLGFGLGVRPRWRLALLVIGTVVASFLLFSTLLGVRLPSGMFR